MKSLNSFFNHLNIIKFSRLSSAFLIVFILISIIAQTYLFYSIKDLNLKKVAIENGYKSLYEFKYETDNLLSSYDINKNKKTFKKALNKYKYSIQSVANSFIISDSVKNFHKIILTKSKEIDHILNTSKVFNEAYLMNKPILVRFGELNRSENKNNFFLEIKSFFEKVEHLKQYQEFMIEDIFEKKEDIYLSSNKKIDTLSKLFIYIPIFITLVAIVFSIIVDYLIRTKERTLTNTKNLLENILNSIPIRVFWKDKNGAYIGANDLFIKDCGLKNKDELIGKTDLQMPWGKTEAKNFNSDDKEVIKSKVAKLNISEQQTRKDGSIAYLNTSKVPLFNEYENVSGVIGIYEDITQRVKSEKKIKAQETQILQQNRLAQMGEMIAMIAHQWRQPLTVISSIIGVLQFKIDKDQYDKDIFKDKFSKVITQTKYLSDTIEDFRNFFRPEKQMSKTTTKELIENTLNIIEPTLVKNDIKLIVNYNCDNQLNTYANEVKQVLLNIIKNAQDAFKENKVKDPYIKIETSTLDKTNCKIIIEDNAGGIAVEIIDKIFDPYFSTKTDKNGTGLGLHMSKMIIEDHCKGKLEVSSFEGKTKFTIKI